MVRVMMGEALIVLVPALAEGLLLALCLMVALRVRRLGGGGVYQLTLAAIGMDAGSQVYQLCARLGHPAGVLWLLHVVMCYTVLYILHRLGELLARMRAEHCTVGVVQGTLLVEEGG
jgi:hypothetical protein